MGLVATGREARFWEAIFVVRGFGHCYAASMEGKFANRLADAVVIVAIVFAWLIAAGQIFVSYKIWMTRIYDYGLVSGLLIYWYIPAILVYLVASSCSQKSRRLMFWVAPVTGILSTFLV